MTLILPGLLLFAVVSAGWFWFENRWDRRLFTPEPGMTCKNLRARAALTWLQATQDAQVLDVRSRREFSRGALPDAMNAPLEDGTFSQQVGRLPRDKPLLVYCAGGYRSRKAVEALRLLGFTSIHHLHRGYHSWQLAGLPVTRPQVSNS